MGVMALWKMLHRIWPNRDRHRVLQDQQVIPPDFTAPFMIEHTNLLCESFRHWTGKALMPADWGRNDVVRALYDAPFAVVSHGTEADPLFNYGNRLALQLFEMSWADFTAMHSRLSAESADQETRQQLLEQVTLRGFTDHYTGVRISGSGRRFLIRNATVWNLITVNGDYRGQAAMIRSWEPLP